MRTEYRIIRDPDFIDDVYNLERKSKFGKWLYLDWSQNKDFLIESAERRFKRQKATEFILIDNTVAEFIFKDGKVLVAA